jgi:hypothetical protein
MSDDKSRWTVEHLQGYARLQREDEEQSARLSRMVNQDRTAFREKMASPRRSRPLKMITCAGCGAPARMWVNCRIQTLCSDCKAER